MYYADILPQSVIVRRQGQLWIVPCIPNGWQSKRRYRGYESVLKPFGTGEAVMRATLGIPKG